MWVKFCHPVKCISWLYFPCSFHIFSSSVCLKYGQTWKSSTITNSQHVHGSEFLLSSLGCWSLSSNLDTCIISHQAVSQIKDVTLGMIKISEVSNYLLALEATIFHTLSLDKLLLVLCNAYQFFLCLCFKVSWDTKYTCICEHFVLQFIPMRCMFGGWYAVISG